MTKKLRLEGSVSFHFCIEVDADEHVIRQLEDDDEWAQCLAEEHVDKIAEQMLDDAIECDSWTVVKEEAK